MNQQAVSEIKKDLDCGRQDSAVMNRTRFVFAEPGGVDIVIRWTRDDRRANNGGEYTYWAEYRIVDGNLYRREACSCDFWQPEVEALNLGPMTYAEFNAALKGV